VFAVTLPAYIRLFLAALYNETAISGYNRFRLGDILDRYSIEWKPMWAENFFRDLRDQNFARTYRIGDNQLDFLLSIAAGGVHWIETQFRDRENLSSYLEANGAVYSGELAAISPGAIDSALWTGTPSERTVAVEKRERLIQLLGQAEIDLELLGASNSDKAMARAYIIAARTLAEAPDPPEDLIWELIDRANSLAGVASLFVAIVALFVSASH